MCRAFRLARAAECRSRTRSPRTASTDIQMWLARDLNGNVGGLREPRPHELVVLLDREPVATFTIQKPAGDDTQLDKDLESAHRGACRTTRDRRHIRQGGFVARRNGRQPLQVRFNERRHPRTAPAIDQVSVTGPHVAKGAENTPSRRRVVRLHVQPEQTRTRTRRARGRF